MPSEANQDGFFLVVRVLTERARERKLHGHAVSELLDEVAWTRMLQQARAAPVPDAPLPDVSQRGEVVLYLRALIEWLNADPWPHWFGGPALTPGAIERRLRIASGRQGGQDLDADELASQCVRLVVLGGPGSGKTWLARRAARLCAETALEGIAAGDALDEVELPLYTTCARLSAMSAGDDIRRAVVSSALGLIPDLGGVRITASVRELFEERNSPTLLVADSLDEAYGADDRIRQADTLPDAWRIVLTSRPGSWKHQLAIGDDSPLRMVGILQPLRYPDDAEPFVARWFAARPARAADLTAQLRERPALQQAATVPLILTFYCIIGDDQPLPGRRADLYARVIRRMLTGRWRGSSDRDLNPDSCIETLRAWAWSAAVSDPVSGVGTWTDDFPAPRVKQSQDDRNALDHLAAPLGPPDVDTGMIWRRFVHRSIREHLVAEHIALTMPAQEAVGELLNHLWYDQDWEYAAPAALAMHPERDQVLKDLICSVTGGDRFPANLAAVDGCWAIRRFLARVAQESSERDWASEQAGMISQARQDLAIAWRDGDLSDAWTLEEKLDRNAPDQPPDLAAGFDEVVASDWPTSNGLILQSLLAPLTSETDPGDFWGITEKVARFAVMGQERARAGDALLALLDGKTTPQVAKRLAQMVATLDPAGEQRARARNSLLARLDSETDPKMAQGLAWAVAELGPTAEEWTRAQQRLLAGLGEDGLRMISALLLRVADLAVTAEERVSSEETLLALLDRETDYERVWLMAKKTADFAITAGERERARSALLALLTRGTHLQAVDVLAEAVVRLDPTSEERAHARQALLASLTAETDSWVAHKLAEAVVSLDPTSEERAHARQALLASLTAETDSSVARELAGVVVRLDPTSEERAGARHTLLALLIREHDPDIRSELAESVAGLAMTAQERACTRAALLALLSGETESRTAGRLAEMIAELGPTGEERARARQVLLALLSRDFPAGAAEGLVEKTLRLAISDAEQARARQMMLRLLSREQHSEAPGLRPEVLRWLAVTAEEQGRAREVLLRLLTRETDLWATKNLVEAVSGMDPTGEERTRMREALLAALLYSEVRFEEYGRPDEKEMIIGLAVTTQERAHTRERLMALLSGETRPWEVVWLATLMAALDPTVEEQARTWERLLALLSREIDPRGAIQLAGAVAVLDPIVEDWTRTREALLAFLRRETNFEMAQRLSDMVAELSPTVADLDDSSTWQFRPTPELMAAARWNSALPAWLAALPLLLFTLNPPALRLVPIATGHGLQKIICASICREPCLLICCAELAFDANERAELTIGRTLAACRTAHDYTGTQRPLFGHLRAFSAIDYAPRSISSALASGTAVIYRV